MCCKNGSPHSASPCGPPEEKLPLALAVHLTPAEAAKTGQTALAVADKSTYKPKPRKLAQNTYSPNSKHLASRNLNANTKKSRATSDKSKGTRQALTKRHKDAHETKR